MKKTKSQFQSIRHPSVLCQTIKTEKWLHKMAQDGFVLVNVRGNQYRFELTSPQKCFYFAMTPETGTNSDVWVFHELEQKAGKKITCSGPSFFSPSHMLLINETNLEGKSAIIFYYYQYRNYRLLKRFRRNAIFSSIFLVLGVVMGSLRFPLYIADLFPYLLVSGLLLLHFSVSYFLFHKDCVQSGYTDPAKKPQRPQKTGEGDKGGQGDGSVVP